MPLNWNISEVKDFEQLLDEKGSPHRLTTSLIYACMPVSLSSITERNHIDFFTRIVIYESCFGAFMTRPFELEDIKRHIGLKTNCSNSSYPAFLKKVYNIVNQEVKHNERF